MVILWPACFSRFSVWMVTLSTGSPPFDYGLWRSASAPLPGGSPAGEGSATPGALNLSSPEGSRATGKSFFGQGQVVVYPLAHLPDHRDEVVQVGGVVHEVDVAGVDHQQRRLRVVEEEVVVGPGKGLEVVGVEVALVVPAAALDALEEHLQPALEEDHQVRLRHPGTERVVNPVVEGQL